MDVVIHHHNYVKRETIVCSLDRAKEKALEIMCFTGENITIEDLEGQVITTSYWINRPPTEFDDVLEVLGEEGFYQLWTDELEQNVF